MRECDSYSFSILKYIYRYLQYFFYTDKWVTSKETCHFYFILEQTIAGPFHKSSKYAKLNDLVSLGHTSCWPRLKRLGASCFKNLHFEMRLIQILIKCLVNLVFPIILLPKTRCQLVHSLGEQKNETSDWLNLENSQKTPTKSGLFEIRFMLKTLQKWHLVNISE